MKTKKRDVIKICVVDGRPFTVYPKKKSYHHYHGKSGKYKRPIHSVTCSRQCSRIYAKHREKYLKVSKSKK